MQFESCISLSFTIVLYINGFFNTFPGAPSTFPVYTLCHDFNFLALLKTQVHCLFTFLPTFLIWIKAFFRTRHFNLSAIHEQR